MSLGVAAHITAASEGGPRYDPGLAAADRSAMSNGIWLCQNCAKLIDNDPSAFSTSLLYEWKTGAENRTRAALQAGGRDHLEAGCPRCDAHRAELWEQRRTLLRSRISESAENDVPRALSQISQAAIDRGLYGSTVELTGKLGVRRKAREKALRSLVQTDAVLAKECCGEHRLKTINEAKESITESCAAAVEAASGEVESFMTRARLGRGVAESCIEGERRRIVALERSAHRDLDLLLLDAQLSYTANVAEPTQALLEQRDTEERALALAEKTVNEIVTKRIGTFAGAKHEEAQSSVEKWIGLGLPENLERGIVAGAGIILRVAKVSSPPGTARVDGIAFRLSQRPGAPSLWLPGHHLYHKRKCFDVVYAGPADPDLIQDAVDDFIVDRLKAIVEHGRPLFDERMVWEREKIAAKVEKRRPQGEYEPPFLVAFLGRDREQIFEGKVEFDRLTRP